MDTNNTLQEETLLHGSHLNAAMHHIVLAYAHIAEHTRHQDFRNVLTLLDASLRIVNDMNNPKQVMPVKQQGFVVSATFNPQTGKFDQSNTFALNDIAPVRILQQLVEIITSIEHQVVEINHIESTKINSSVSELLDDLNLAVQADTYVADATRAFCQANPVVYHRSVEFQDYLRAEGIAWHNPISDECTSDFECCAKGPNPSIKLRIPAKRNL